MVRITQARRATLAIYFVFGFAVISWVPRIPEVKANIGVSAGIFGALTSFGTLGAVCSSFLASRVIHFVGSKKSTAFFGTSAFVLVALIPLQRVPALYALLMVFYGASVNALSTSLNVQSLHIEERRGSPSMSAFHGSWAAGALATSLISTILVRFINLELQILVTAGLALFVLLIQVPKLISSDEEDSHAEEPIRIKDLFRPSRTALLIGIGISGGSFAEYASGDWSAIYVRETLNTSLDRAAFTFTFIMLAITISRLIGDRLIKRFGPVLVIRAAGSAVVGGLSLVSMAGHLGEGSLIAILLAYSGFALTGLGSGVMVPTFISATTNIDAPRPIALGQVILIQQASIWVLKGIMSIAVAHIGLENAILVPALVAVAAISLAQLTEKQRRAVQPQGQ